MTPLRQAPVVPPTARPQHRDDVPRWQPNQRAVRWAVDLLGVLGVVVGMATDTFTLSFGGAVVLLAGMCLHASDAGQETPGR